MDPRSGRRCRESPWSLLCPWISELDVELADVVRQVLVDRQLRKLFEDRAVDPGSLPNRSELGNRSPRHGDRELLPGLGPPEDLADLVAELFLRDLRHATQGSKSATWNRRGASGRV